VPPPGSHPLHYAPPPARSWRWRSFFGGVAAGLLGTVVIAFVLGWIINWAGLRSGGIFFVLFVPLLAAFAGANVLLERRRLASRGYALGVAISLGVNGLICGLCGSMR
jgi:hypothetical protein